MTNVNPMQLLQMIKGGSNPQQLIMSVLEQQAQNNPMYANIMKLAKNKDSEGLEKIARNLARERGLDFDKEFANFRQNFSILK